MTTGSFMVATGDGSCYRGTDTDFVWSTVRDSLVGTPVNSATVGDCHAYYFTVWTTYGIERGFFPVDTSALPDDATINSATLNVYSEGVGGGDYRGYFNIVSSAQFLTFMILNGDYDSLGSTAYCDSNVHALTNDWIEFDFNATGKTAINKTGYTMLGMRENHDLNNITPFYDWQMAWRTADYSGTGYDPYLDVTYNEEEGARIQINISDTWKNISGLQVNIGDAWKNVSGVQINIGDDWKEIMAL